MSAVMPLSLVLLDEDDTCRLAEHLAASLRAGDAILLGGPIGAGKTHFCRAFIRARLGRNEDVPSPTFTLVQTYEADVDIWHADLYRLTHPNQAIELGLDGAFDTAICLIEWPDRLGTHLPRGALRLSLRPMGDGDRRLAELDLGGREDLRATLLQDFTQTTRADLAMAFIAQSGWGEAFRQPLAEDASARRYERLSLPQRSAILMDAQPHTAESTTVFARVDRHLRALGLSAPNILAEDHPHDFLLLEDLGDGIYAQLIKAEPQCEFGLYAAATDVLLHLQGQPPAPDLPNLMPQDWAEAAALAIDFYRFAITGKATGRADLVTCLTTLHLRHADGPRVMILRDYHAENLLWLPDRSGLARVGLLDFQLAQLGQPGYDLVSQLQDARRDVSPEIEVAMVRRFVDGNGSDMADFARAYAVLGAQRALRILGIFAKLCLASAKPQYLPLLPRVWHQLQRNLAHPELSDLARIVADLLPEPTDPILAKIRAQCGNFP